MKQTQEKSPAATEDQQTQTKMYWNNFTANFFEAQQRMAANDRKWYADCPRCGNNNDCTCAD